jgi:cell division protein FtsB
MPRPTRRTARFLVLLVTVLLVGNAILGDRGYLSMIRAADQMEQLSQSIAAVRARNDALRENARQLREEAWRIAELARGELGMMQPGERLFIVTDRPPAAASDASEVAEPAPPAQP